MSEQRSMNDQQPTEAQIRDALKYALFGAGYDEDLKEYSRRIQNSPAEVLQFAEIYTEATHDGFCPYLPDDVSFGQAIYDSGAELGEFLDGMPPDRLLSTFFRFFNYGAFVTAEIGWLDARVGPVVWDRWTGPVVDPVMAFADMYEHFGQSEYRCDPPPKLVPDPPLYRFHPERFKAFHDCAEVIGKIYRHQVEPKSGMLTLPQMQEIMKAIYDEDGRKAMLYPRKWKDDLPSPSLAMESALTLGTSYGRFVQAGRQIMDFPPALIEMLGSTDVDDIPLDTIKLPYASQYLHFGPQKHLELAPGWLVDGAYVEARGEPGDIRFTLTSVPIDRSLSRHWYVIPEPEYTQDFVQDFRHMDLATAMDTVLADRLHGLNEKRAKAGGDITSQVQTAFREAGEMAPEGVKVVDVSPSMAQIRLDQENERFPVYGAALRLVVNALCYVTAYPEDIATVWPDGTPASLKDKAEGGKGKEVQRAKSKLAALGYVPIHICGQRVETERARAGIGGHEHPSSHWRRGHWRNQPYGPARMLRKLRWMMPTWVGARREDEEPTGHLYLVS